MPPVTQHPAGGQGSSQDSVRHLLSTTTSGSSLSLSSLAGQAEDYSSHHHGRPVWAAAPAGDDDNDAGGDDDDKIELIRMNGAGGDGGDGHGDGPAPAGHGHGHGGAAPAGMLSFALQVAPSLMLSGCGMLGAGALLDVVQHWPLFVDISELFILAPALLGLKGNLEMVLASRLSTAAHKGQLDDKAGRWSMVVANLMLVQVQAIVVALAASIFSFIMGAIFNGEFKVRDALLIMAAAIATASLASVLLGGIMCGIVIASRIVEIDPDNVATPIAAALGDLCTLLLLTAIGTLLHAMNEIGSILISITLIALYVGVLLPAAYRHIRFRPTELAVLKDKAGWGAILVAMMVSSGAGVVLERSITTFESLAVLAPLMNGLGGNLAVVHASKLSTALHTNAKVSKVRNALVLFLLVLPTSYIFLFLVRGLHLGHTHIDGVFLSGYSIAALTQVFILLLAGTKIVALVWKRGLDPDQVAIPIVTAMGDLVGTSALVSCFHALRSMGQPV